MQKLQHFFSKNISIYAVFNDQSFNDMLTNDILLLPNNIFSFEQLGPVHYKTVLDIRLYKDGPQKGFIQTKMHKGGPQNGFIQRKMYRSYRKITVYGHFST